MLFEKPRHLHGADFAPLIPEAQNHALHRVSWLHRLPSWIDVRCDLCLPKAKLHQPAPLLDVLATEADLAHNPCRALHKWFNWIEVRHHSGREKCAGRVA